LSRFAENEEDSVQLREAALGGPMAKKAKLTPAQERKQLLDYIAFLQKRLESKNYKANVTPEEYQKTKEKYDKAKFRLKILK
jgi:hypothetical protein